MNKAEVEDGQIVGINNDKAIIEIPNDIPIIAIHAYKYDHLSGIFFLDPEKNNPDNPLYRHEIKDIPLQFSQKSE